MLCMLYTDSYGKASYRKDVIKQIIRKIHLQFVLKKSLHISGPVCSNLCYSRVNLIFKIMNYITL